MTAYGWTEVSEAQLNYAERQAERYRVVARFAALPTAVHVYGGYQVTIGAGVVGSISGQYDVVLNLHEPDLGLVGSGQAVAGVGGLHAEGGLFGGAGLLWNTSSIGAEEGSYRTIQVGAQGEAAGLGAGGGVQASEADSRDPVLEALILDQAGIEYEARPWSVGISANLTGGPGNINAIDAQAMAGRGYTVVIGTLRRGLQGAR